MSCGDELRRQDILDACDELASVVAARSAESSDEQMLVRAAERLLEIIGEAAGSCSAEFRLQYPEVDWSGLSELRVVLAHVYHRSDPRLIWRYAEVNAPVLREALAGETTGAEG